MLALQSEASRIGRWRKSICSVARFGLFVFLIAGLLAAITTPWLELDAWRVFRRCVSIAAALSLWIVLRCIEKKPWRSLGFLDAAAGKRELKFGLLLGIGTLFLMLAIGLVTGACRISVTPDHLKLWRTLLGFIPAALLVGLLEEAVFRGFILQRLLGCSRVFAVVASSALYSIVHLKTRALSMGTWLELAGLFLLGVVLALAYLRTRQLCLSMGLHAALAYGARVNKLVIGFPEASIAWLTGTSRLVNGVAGWVALLVIGAIIMQWTARQQGG